MRNFSLLLAVTFLGLILAGEFLAPASLSAKMISIDRAKVNMRNGPGTKYQVTWVLKRGYPLQVIGKKGKWYKVRDFEGDTGWVYASLTNTQAHFVVKKSKVNMRSGPGTKYRVVAQAKRGVVLKTIKQVKGWAKVRHENGVTAWVARHLLWGW